MPLQGKGFKLSSAVGGSVTFNQLPHFGDQFDTDCNQDCPDEFARHPLYSHDIIMKEFRATFTMNSTVKAALITFFTNNKGGPILVEYRDGTVLQINTTMWIREPQLEFRSVDTNPCTLYETTLTFFKPIGGA